VSQLENQLNNQQTKSKGCLFIAPSLEDVADYFLERMPNANSEDALHFADVFISHYTNTGWKYGKNKMKDWKAAMRSAWDLSKFVTTKNNHNETIGRIQRDSLQQWVNS
jgi:thiamine kinase-like enzyme